MEETQEQFACPECDETFDEKEQLNEHLKEAHGIAPDEQSEESVAADSDASAATGSITEETNDSPSAAEPSEAAGPSKNDADVRPDDSDDET